MQTLPHSAAQKRKKKNDRKNLIYFWWTQLKTARVKTSVMFF